MKPDEIKSWRGNRNQKEAAASIGRSARQLRDYESGRVNIPLTVELACMAERINSKEYVHVLVYAEFPIKNGDTLKVINPFLTLTFNGLKFKPSFWETF